MQTLSMSKTKIFLYIIIIFILNLKVSAEEFSISDNNLIISGQKIQDSEKILSLLQNNQNIDTVIFKEVSGGSQLHAMEIGDILIDFEVDTHISGWCLGNCIYMFVMGEKRTMERGSEIGIEFYSYGQEQMRLILEDKSYEYYYDTLEEYIVWIDESARNDIVDYFSLLVERNIQPDFIIKSLKKGSIERWIPRRKELLEGNILTE